MAPSVELTTWTDLCQQVTCEAYCEKATQLRMVGETHEAVSGLPGSWVPTKFALGLEWDASYSLDMVSLTPHNPVLWAWLWTKAAAEMVWELWHRTMYPNRQSEVIKASAVQVPSTARMQDHRCLATLSSLDQVSSEHKFAP